VQWAGPGRRRVGAWLKAPQWVWKPVGRFADFLRAACSAPPPDPSTSPLRSPAQKGGREEWLSEFLNTPVAGAGAKVGVGATTTATIFAFRILPERRRDSLPKMKVMDPGLRVPFPKKDRGWAHREQLR
jgi:hypothetical protein